VRKKAAAVVILLAAQAVEEGRPRILGAELRGTAVIAQAARRGMEADSPEADTPGIAAVIAQVRPLPPVRLLRVTAAAAATRGLAPEARPRATSRDPAILRRLGNPAGSITDRTAVRLRYLRALTVDLNAVTPANRAAEQLIIPATTIAVSVDESLRTRNESGRRRADSWARVQSVV